MADSDCTGNSRPIKIPTDWIQMRGRWLKATGFAIGTKIKVRGQRGRLVLPPEEG